MQSADRLIHLSAQEAFGKPGEPGNGEEIVWVSRMLGIVLENTLKWARRIRCARVEAPFDRLTPELALFGDHLINQLQEFPREGLRKVEEALTLATPESPQKLEMTMKLELSNEKAFYEALQQAQHYYDPH